MKWKILNSGFIPGLKCGAAMTGLDMIANMGTNNMQAENVSRQLRAQEYENKLNRDWQTEQAEADRQFQAGQQNIAFVQQQQLQSQQQQYNLQSMAKQAYYNSPAYMRQQLQAANINPQVYFGSHASFGGSSALSGGSPSAPSPAHGVMPGSVSGLSPVSYHPQAIDVAAIAGAMKNFAEAKKLGVETDWLPRTLQQDIMNKKSYTDLNQALTLGQKINNELQNAKVPYAIKQAAADLAKTISEAELNDERKLTESSQQKVNSSLQRLNDSLEKLNSKEYERYGIFLRYYENMLQEQLNNLRSDTVLKGAQASESRSNASFTGYRESMERAMESGNLAMFEDSLVKSYNESLISSEDYRAAKAAADIARTSADHAEALFWKDFIMDIVDEGVGAFLGYKNAKSWQRLSESSQKRTAGKIEQLRQEYGDKVVLEDKWHGKKRTRTYHSGKQKYAD